MQEMIVELIKDSIEVKNDLLKDNETIRHIKQSAKMIVSSLRQGNKLLLCGNGGSAADAQHLAAEMVGRFKLERKGIPAVALTTNTSILTAIANDYHYDKIFARQLEALGQNGDVLIGISTSGNSKNVASAINMAKEKGIKTIGLLGNNGGLVKDLADIAIIVPSNDTPRIQESHIMIGHIICELVEKEMVDSYEE